MQHNKSWKKYGATIPETTAQPVNCALRIEMQKYATVGRDYILYRWQNCFVLVIFAQWKKKSRFQVVVQWHKHNNKGDIKTEKASYHS